LRLRISLLLAALCVLAYARALSLPLFEDDYPNLALAQDYGSPAAISKTFANPTIGVRATSYWTIWAVLRLAGFRPWAFHAFSLLLHIANTWLVYWVALMWPRMRPGAPWAAAFFAVQEGHQEAVMWFTAITELWMFLGGVGALLCWIKGRRAAALALFVLALISKESAVVFLPLFLLVTPLDEWRASVVRLAPFAAVGALAVLWIFGTHTFRLSDGSFSLHAPFLITWPRGIGRLMWFWGWLALACIMIRRDAKLRRAALWVLAWIAIALGPYAFLTYSTEIPSRQTYLASCGLALIVGLALASLPRRSAAIIVMAVMVAANVGYLWTKKQAQFRARSAPTEQLIVLAKRTEGPIWVRCWPLIHWTAEEAVHWGAGRDPSALVWTTEEDAKTQNATAQFCFERH